MTEQHPITPPPELRRLWAQQAQRLDPYDPAAWMEHVSTQAARWGSDQELEACCSWLQRNDPCEHDFPQMIRAARRPKPPSLREQALEALGGLEKRCDLQCNLAAIRRALESLPD